MTSWWSGPGAGRGRGRGGKGGGGKGRGYGGWGYGTFNSGPIGPTLDTMPPGSIVKIVNILGGPNFVSRLYSMGLGIGSTLRVEANDVRGLIIDVNGIKYGVGRGFASKIIVERIG